MVACLILNSNCLCFYRRIRKKRDTSDAESDDDSDEDLLPESEIEDPPPTAEIPGPEGFHPNDTWPTDNGVTLESATASCETPIMSLPIFDACDEHTVDSRQAIINSCILDIQVGRGSEYCVYFVNVIEQKRNIKHKRTVQFVAVCLA